jgi:ABC-type nitrate/sulfonate/bicarbonate transport system substrate-binding protein
MQSRRKFIKSTGVALAASGLILGAPAIVRGKGTTVRLAIGRNVWGALGHLAYGKGFFKKEGLNVEMNYIQGGRFALEAVLSGSAEVGAIVEVNIAYIAFQGVTNFISPANIVSSTSSAIIARKSAGINKPSDLKGKRLALSPAMTSDIYARRVLSKYGMTEKDVELVKVMPLAMQGTMVAKGADAASIWQPFVYNIARQLGDDAIIFKDPDVYTGYEMYAIGRDYAAKNSEVVKAVLRATRAAENFAKANPKEAQEIVAKEIRLDVKIVAGIWPEFDMRVELDKPRMTGDVTRIGQWIRETQPDFRGKPLPNYSQYFDTTYLNALG